MPGLVWYHVGSLYNVVLYVAILLSSTPLFLSMLLGSFRNAQGSFRNMQGSFYDVVSNITMSLPSIPLFGDCGGVLSGISPETRNAFDFTF